MDFRASKSLRALIDELKQLIAGVAVQATTNANRTQAQNGVAVPAAAPAVFDTPVPFTSKTGNVRVSVSLSVTGTGGTSVAAEQIKFSIRVGGALFAASPVAFVEVGATELDAAATLTFELGGIGVGATQTYGVEAQNITTPAHTLVIPALGALVRVEDTL
jgi:hypothetical protein